MLIDSEKPPLLDVGDKFPRFQLLDQDGVIVNSEDLAGKRFVIFFYPKDNTAGCTREAKEFTEALPKFDEKGIHVFGVSKDSVKSHRNFIDKQELGVRLLSDPDHELMEKAGAWGPKISYGRISIGAIRSTFVVSESGLIEALWRNVRVPGHVDNVLSYLGL